VANNETIGFFLLLLDLL